MLEANYKDIKYTFNITTKDVSPLNPTYSAFLFKFTNDMSGDVKWAYGQNTVIRNRYTTVDFFHDTTEDIFTGKVNFDPQGYWKYDVFQVPFNSTPVLDNCNAINPTYIAWNVKDSAATLLDSGTFDLYDYKLSGLTNALSPYDFNLYPDCVPTGGIVSATVGLKSIETNPKRFVHVDKITQTTTGIIVDIYSTSTQRTFIEFTPTAGGSTVTTPITTTTPYNISVFLPDLSVGLTGTTYSFKLYEDTNVVDTYNNIVSETKPSGLTSNSSVMFVNNEYETGWGEGTDLGSVFFTSQYSFFPITPYTPPTGTTFEDLRVEVGKLLVNEENGSEQVQYTQHKTKQTNYIYNE